MNLVKWDPLRELEGLHTRLGRFMNEWPVGENNDEGSFFAAWTPAVDVQETEKEYIVKVDLPEVRREDVKVAMEEGVLTVEGERKQQKEEQGKRFHRIERAYGKFVRRFAMPTEIDAAKTLAEFKDGVLSVRLPKTAMAKPKAVEVKVA